MDKKTTYYVIGAVILIVVIAIVVAMQANNRPQPPVGGNENPPVETKTETEVTREIGQQLSLPEGTIPLRVTMDDNGQTAKLTPGKYLVMMLGNDYVWDIKSSDDTVLAKRDVKLDDDRSQAVYQIVHPGKAVLSATGTCKSGSTCAAQTQSFTFNIEGVVTDDVPAGDLVK